MKTTQTFAVRFIALPKLNSQNEACVYARITISKKVVDISLKKTVSIFCGIQRENVLTVKHLKQNKSISLLMIPVSG